MASGRDTAGIFSLIGGGIYVFVTWCVGLAISCWLTNIQVEERWHSRYREIRKEEDYDVFHELIRSWQATPFVDLIATYDTEEFCPDSHRDELAFDMWPGSYTHCDCLQSPSRRYVAMHQWCHRWVDDDYEGPHATALCYDVGGKEAILQNRFKGIRFCGNRSNTSIKYMARPQKNGDG